LSQLRQETGESIAFEGDQLIVKHLYIERRMIPLNLYLKSADEAAVRHAVKEYRDAVRQLAAANIFPGHLLFKNFGVTRNGRVVFYDYDELCYLTECNFREIPEAPFPEMEMSAEPWYTPGPNDIFPEELETFLLTDDRIRRIFLELHRDLLDPAWWRQRQDNILAGQLEDVFPYPQAQRFHRPDSPAGTPVKLPSRRVVALAG